MTGVVPVGAAGSGSACTIVGTPGDDVLEGTAGPDVMCGRGGDDVLSGHGGDDVLVGGDGADVLVGGDGNDLLDGGNDADRLDGGAGEDNLNGGHGNDVLTGGDGSDSLSGESGADRVDGGAGADKLNGGDGDDLLRGGDAADVLEGGSGADELFGASGADVLLAGDGEDLLVGGSEGDRLYGGFGGDRLLGGSGDDDLDGGPGQDRCHAGSGTGTEVGCEAMHDRVEGDGDADGVPDEIELIAGLAEGRSDTDGDGLSDGDEFELGTDPLREDSDGDGVSDASSDLDGDGLEARQEQGLRTDPLESDTDADGLGDGDEVERGTDPLVADSDDDGIDDGAEVVLGLDPQIADSDGDGVLDGLDETDRQLAHEATGIEFVARGLPSAILAVELDSPQDRRLSKVPGQRGPPIEVLVPKRIAEGTLTFRFDSGDVPAGADLAILHFDADTGAFDRPDGQHIDVAAGIATVTVREFSPFVLVDLAVFGAVWERQMQAPREGAAGESIDAVLVLDSSGSMSTSDRKGAQAAATSFVDALLEGDRGAVVDFDSRAQLLQGLTPDKESLRAAIQRIDSSGGTNIGAGVKSALDELDARTGAGSGRIVVLLTDGQGSYDPSLTSRAAASRTTIFTVGLGSGVDTGLLGQIAEGTGGLYFQVADAEGLKDAYDRVGDELGAPDTDGDGIADEVEVKGARDGVGLIYLTDPYDPDTDGDGLTDGDELGEIKYKYEVPASGGFPLLSSYFELIANPTTPDTDGDGCTDAEERDGGTFVDRGDSDHDGLSDFVEGEAHSTHPLDGDSDHDEYTDAWELAHEVEGFDPIDPDIKVSKWEYVGDAARGALCGDVEGIFGFCDNPSVAFVAGSIAVGVVGVGDVRDFFASAIKGDFVSAGLSAAALIPIAGDATSAISKAVKGAQRSDGMSMFFIRMIADLPVSDARKVAALRQIAPSVVDRARAAGVDDGALVKIMRRAPKAKHFEDVFEGAAAVKRSGADYALEDTAEGYLRSITPGALADKVQIAHIVGGTKSVRFHDITTDGGLVIEVKHGRTYGAGRASRQAERDAAMLNDAEFPKVKKVEWHFFTHANGTLGPDVNLLGTLNSLGIPYTIWLP